MVDVLLFIVIVLLKLELMSLIHNVADADHVDAITSYSGMAAIVQIAGGSGINSEETAIITKPACTSPLPVLEAAVGEFAVPTLATGRAAYTVVDTLADLRDVKAGPDGIGYINAGSSIVYTLNVATAGTYNVVYTMNSFNGAPAGINLTALLTLQHARSIQWLLLT
eukprot:2246-Heterococcus_DN1.PRE.1